MKQNGPGKSSRRSEEGAGGGDECFDDARAARHTKMCLLVGPRVQPPYSGEQRRTGIFTCPRMSLPPSRRCHSTGSYYEVFHSRVVSHDAMRKSQKPYGRRTVLGSRKAARPVRASRPSYEYSSFSGGAESLPADTPRDHHAPSVRYEQRHDVWPSKETVCPCCAYAVFPT